MELLLNRIYKSDTYTIGKLYLDGQYFCDTLEDKDRGLDSTMSEKEIEKIKVYGETAIPTGKYEILTDVISPKFSKYDFYKTVCNGRLPRLSGVKGFSGILIHVADGTKGSKLIQGCIGIGKNKIKGGLLEGKETFKKLWEIIKDKKPLYITIK